MFVEELFEELGHYANISIFGKLNLPDSTDRWIANPFSEFDIGKNYFLL